MRYGEQCQKIYTQFVVAPTGINYYSYHAETFPDVTPLLKVDRFEGFLNWCKINGMVNDNSSSCNSNAFFKN